MELLDANMNLNQIETLERINKLDWKSDLLPHAHIIVGTGARCMCGIYGTEALTCSDIINQLRSAEMLKPTGPNESEM